MLDQIGSENPVLLIHASSHMGVTNSRGLEVQGITEATEDCPGGRYGRVAENERTGWLHGREGISGIPGKASDDIDGGVDATDRGSAEDVCKLRG